MKLNKEHDFLESLYFGPMLERAVMRENKVLETFQEIPHTLGETSQAAGGFPWSLESWQIKAAHVPIPFKSQSGLELASKSLRNQSD